MMISIVMPTYNPNIKEFKKAVQSAVDTNSNEIIIVDDCSDNENVEYFDYLKGLESQSRIKIHYNKENKGRFLNSYYALTLATNDYVKKLDSDDKLIPNEFNKLLLEEHSSSIIFTRYKFKNKQKNKSRSERWNIFNGSSIYRRKDLDDLDLNNTPRNFFGDIIFISHITSKENSEVSFSKLSPYRYMVVGSTTPKKILAKAEDWLVGYEWFKNTTKTRPELEMTIEKQDIFYQLMMLKLGLEYDDRRFKYFKSWNYAPKFVKRMAAYFTFKF